MIPLRTGNLGVARLHASRRGAWELVEPAPGCFDWSLQRENARAAASAGLQYVVYPWSHAAPGWHRDGEAFVPARCLEHGRAGPAPSLFASSNWDAAERFWRAVAAGLGDVADGVVGAFPADSGEVGCLCGVAGWLLGEDPVRDHQHAGLWCDAWLAGELPPGVPAVRSQAVARDRTQSCLVTEFGGGLLLHNPDDQRSATPHLVGGAARAASSAPAPLAPLETRWLPLGG